MPHADVASGRYQQAEFAADLWQAYLHDHPELRSAAEQAGRAAPAGEGDREYLDPVEFFRRTYLTESLKGLLAGAARRITGGGGDPVVQLQTNFGGGKTHSMLAVYHLCSGVAPSEPGRGGCADAGSRRAGAAGGAAGGSGGQPHLARQSGRRSRTGRWCARCGASWRGSWAARRRMRASRATTSTRRVPATRCGSSWSSTVRA